MTTKEAAAQIATEETPVLDLAIYDELQRAQERGIEVPIKDPSGKSMGFSIKVAGPDSSVQKAAVRILTKERIESNSIEELTPDQQEIRSARGLALATMGWSKFVLDGAEYKFTVDSAQALYLRFPFIRDQVEFKAERRAAFLPA